jgi:hypothetical protein
MGIADLATVGGLGVSDHKPKPRHGPTKFKLRFAGLAVFGKPIGKSVGST